MKLITDLIPHEKFHKGIWLSNEMVPWYFFVQTNRDFTIPKDEDFYGSVDSQLLPIVKLLHKNEIPTTPSCAGHFEGEDYYSEIYDLLKNFSQNIKKGVILYNDENDKKFLYKNKNYKLPWKKDEFLNEIIKYQKNGVIGFKDENGTIYKNIEEDNFKKIKDKEITLITVNSDDMGEMEYKWKNIYKQIKELLL